MSKIIGIDLGTTNSCAAVVDVTQPVVIPNREGARTTASVVAFTESGEWLVGQMARRQAMTNPERTVSAVKRLIGRRFQTPEVAHAAELAPFRIIEASNGDAYVEIDGKQHSPQEISSLVLREIKEAAEAYLESTVEQAIITVPAYFDDSQRQATKDAGVIAGFDVKRIINEPTAAALAYGMGKTDGGEEVVAVYDLGGGTFDISILQIEGGLFEVRSTSGDTFLGGEDFDARVVRHLVKKFREETGIDLLEDPMAMQRVTEAAESAKCELSTADVTEISLPFISADHSGPKHMQVSFSRSELEGLIGDLVKKTLEPCANALEAAELEPGDIDQVILVGGQTRMPLVIETVRDFFGSAPCRDINPDEVVGIGAAIQGGILKGEVKDLVLLDVTPLSLGIKTRGELFTKIIDRNSTIPTKRSMMFTTVEDNQTMVEINVLQGERSIASENKSLGQFDLVGIRPQPRGVPQIEVTFAIDSDGIVQVSAQDIATGKEQSIEVTPAGGLNKAEIDSIIAEADKYREYDEERRKIRKLQNRLDGLIHTNERVVKEFGGSLEAKDRTEVRETLQRAKRAVDSEDLATLEEAIRGVELAAEVLSEVIMFDPTMALKLAGSDSGPEDDSSEEEL